MILKGNQSNSPFSLDSYSTRAKRTTRIYTPDNPYARKTINILAVLIFIIIDFTTLFSVWNCVMLENPVYVLCVCMGCAIALDAPLAVGAIALKKYHHGFMKREEAMLTVILSVSVFAIAFAFSLAFRLVTKDLSFDVGTSSTLINTVGSTTTENPEGHTSILVAALFNGILPFLTSISSFVISYFSTDPVNEKLKTLETEKITLQGNIIEVDSAIAQSDDAIIHCNSLLAREKDLYAEFIEQLNAENQTLKQIARLVLMEKVNDSNAITNLIESGKEVYNSTSHSEEPYSEFDEFLGTKFSNKKNLLVAENRLIA